MATATIHCEIKTYKVYFQVRGKKDDNKSKNVSENIEKEFIGTKENLYTYIRNEVRYLREIYNNAYYLNHKPQLPDARLLFGNGKP